MKLEGKIVGPWVQELRRTWDSLASGVDSRKFLVDLCNVAFVDDEGKQVLREIYRKTGAEFVADSPLTRHFAQQAKQQLEKNGRGV